MTFDKPISLFIATVCKTIAMQACLSGGGGGEVEGVCSNPPFGLQKILYTLLKYNLGDLPFESGPL